MKGGERQCPDFPSKEGRVDGYVTTKRRVCSRELGEERWSGSYSSWMVLSLSAKLQQSTEEMLPPK